jgi:hypothetical protein
MRIQAFVDRTGGSAAELCGPYLQHRLACSRDTLASGSASAIGRIAGTFVSAKTPIPAETTRAVIVERPRRFPPTHDFVT